MVSCYGPRSKNGRRATTVPAARSVCTGMPRPSRIGCFSDRCRRLDGQRGADKARREQHAAAEARTAARALALPVQMRFRARRRRAKARREALLLGEVAAILEEAARRLAE